jgi:hypothetical protein
MISVNQPTQELIKCATSARIHFTMADRGVRRSYSCWYPRSQSVASLESSSKSKIFRFSTILSFRTDFSSTTTPVESLSAKRLDQYFHRVWSRWPSTLHSRRDCCGPVAFQLFRHVLNRERTHLHLTILALPNLRLNATTRCCEIQRRLVGESQAIQSWFFPGDNLRREFL